MHYSLEWKSENWIKNSFKPDIIFLINDNNDFIKQNIPVNRLGHPEEVANIVLFISSKYSSFINGSNLVIDGGLSNS